MPTGHTVDGREFFVIYSKDGILVLFDKADSAEIELRLRTLLNDIQSVGTLSLARINQLLNIRDSENILYRGWLFDSMPTLKNGTWEGMDTLYLEFPKLIPFTDPTTFYTPKNFVPGWPMRSGRYPWPEKNIDKDKEDI